jgi:alkylhydroperoxidase family enzyme
VTPPYDADTAAALEVLGPPIGIFRVFARRPDRAHGMAGWGRYYLSRRCALSLRHRELLILRTTARCGAEYEWGVHVAYFGQRVGLTDAQLTSLTRGTPDDACWPPEERALLRAVDELHDSHDVTDETWAALELTDEQRLDLLMLAGWYHAISYVARAARVPLEPDAPRFGDYPG